MFFLCAHPTLTIREHLLDRHGSKKNIPGKKNYNFYRLFTFISGTALYRSYFGGIFCLDGSNLRLVLGHPTQRHQLFFHKVVTKTPISTERVVYLT